MKNIEILILDFGSQYTQIIAKKLRENGIYSEIVPYNEKIEIIEKISPKGLILSGGPSSIYEKNSYKPNSKIWNLNIPIMGICYGMQIIVDYFKGEIVPSKHHEYGKSKFKIKDSSLDIFHNMNSEKIVWMSHGDRIKKIPNNFLKIGSTENSSYAGITNIEKNIYAFQFHPEVYHSEEGTQLLKNFAKRVCKSDTNWSIYKFAKEKISKIRLEVGNKKVICGVSGGVDSSVVATILNEALKKKQIICIFVNQGLLRKNESEEVKYMFNNLGIDLITIDAQDIFKDKLKGVINPEKKRKIIGTTFIKIFEEEAKKHKDVDFLAQGTLYTDVIESISVKGPSKIIKSHHNVGGLPKDMNLKLIEPLREIFKDEVRILGLELNIPKKMIERHPFPGPGLAIRIMGEVTENSLFLVRESDAIMQDELKANGLYNQVWQAFTVLLNVKSVGVMGDNRTYDNSICVRMVNSIDGMTATFSHIPYEVLEKISSRIINEIKGINRVVYDISSKPPSTIEWE